MLTKRIIPCLDVKDGRVVKGTHFIDLKDAGDPVELAEYYDKEGADELVFLDITASIERRRTIVELVRRTASKVFIPFTVGGGIGSVEEIREILRSGADKVSINTQAVRNPSFIKEASEIFGSQCIVVAIDAKRDENMGGWRVYINGGTTPTNLEAVSWAKEVERLGAGEILLTSIDADGTQQGYDITLTKAVVEMVNIPVIASGGAGNLEHIRDVLKDGKASAALIASLLHYKKYTVKEIKEYLKKEGIPVRL
ncbi:MAG: imidazole glycerol phosphate synthase subunit HisF [bacterium]